MDKIFVLVLFLSISAVQALKEGDKCKTSSSGIEGFCKQLPNCPSALKALQQSQIFPETCGYKGTIPIICCLESSKPTTTSTERPTAAQPTETTSTGSSTTTASSTTVSIGTRIAQRPEGSTVGELSEKKCKEYGKYVFEQKRAALLIPGEDLTVNHSVCGFKAVELIVGGDPAKPSEFPHQALLGYEPKNDSKITWNCGGALISENFVLSAAHCAGTAELGNVKLVRLGELDLDDPKDDARPQDIKIAEMILHPMWKPPDQYYDIMLLRLEKPAVFNRWVRPTCLHTTYYIPPTNSKSNNPKFLATGFGKTDFDQNESNNHLLKVVLDNFNQTECNDVYKHEKRRLPNGIIDKLQICAGGRDEEKDTCQGDSGGPLQIFSRKVYCMYELVGITSFGRSCGTLLVPSVYSRVSEYIDWIEKIVWKDNK